MNPCDTLLSVSSRGIETIGCLFLHFHFFAARVRILTKNIILLSKTRVHCLTVLVPSLPLCSRSRHCLHYNERVFYFCFHGAFVQAFLHTLKFSLIRFVFVPCKDVPILSFSSSKVPLQLFTGEYKVYQLTPTQSHLYIEDCL